MPKSHKKSLSKLIRTIAKKNKISLSKSNKKSLSKSKEVPSDLLRRGVRHIDIRSPTKRPCGSKEKSKDRFMRSELVQLARASGVDSRLKMDDLCAALGINPHVPTVSIPLQRCGSKQRGSDRYTRDELVQLARARDIPVSGKSMDQLCSVLGIHHDEKRDDIRQPSRAVAQVLQKAIQIKSKEKHSEEQYDSLEYSEIIPLELLPLLTISDKDRLLEAQGRVIFPERKAWLMPGDEEKIERILIEVIVRERDNLPGVNQASDELRELYSKISRPSSSSGLTPRSVSPVFPAPRLGSSMPSTPLRPTVLFPSSPSLAPSAPPQSKVFFPSSPSSSLLRLAPSAPSQSKVVFPSSPSSSLLRIVPSAPAGLFSQKKK